MSLLDEKMTSELANSLKKASGAARTSLEETVTRQTTRLRSSTKTRKSAATRERIMAAATSLMVERGNTDFQMSEVSSRCKMSKGALYYYFADKDALVEAIFDRSIDELVDSVEGAVAGASSALEALVSLTRELTCRMSVGSPLALAMTREVIDANNNVLPSMETHFARIISIISAQLDRAKGEGMAFKSINEAILAYENKVVTLHSRVKVRVTRTMPDGTTKTGIIESTVGRFIFNEILHLEEVCLMKSFHRI